MSDPRCKCTMAISLTGDGCRYCQPQEYINRLEEWLDEERQDGVRLQSENEALRARVADLWIALSDAQQIIESDANTEENYGSLCRIGSALKRASSHPWLLRQKADAVGAVLKLYRAGMEAEDMYSEIRDEAQRLRDQADAIGRGGV